MTIFLMLLPMIIAILGLSIFKLYLTSHASLNAIKWSLLEYFILGIYLLYAIFCLFAIVDAFIGVDKSLFLFLGLLAVNLLWLVLLRRGYSGGSRTESVPLIGWIYFVSGLVVLLLLIMIIASPRPASSLLDDNLKLELAKSLFATLSLLIFCRGIYILHLNRNNTALALAIVGVGLLSAYLAGWSLAMVNYFSEYRLSDFSHFVGMLGAVVVIFAGLIKLNP